MPSSTTTAGAMVHGRNLGSNWTAVRLRDRKSAIEREIAVELRRPKPDDLTLGRLKREKLQVKEALINAGDRN